MKNVISLNCHSCPHFDSDTMDCYLDCEDVWECMKAGNPYVDKGQCPDGCEEDCMECPYNA